MEFVLGDAGVTCETFQSMMVNKNKRIERLILGAAVTSRSVASQGKKHTDILLGHGQRVLKLMETYEITYPVPVCFLRTDTVMTNMDGIAELIA